MQVKSSRPILALRGMKLVVLARAQHETYGLYLRPGWGLRRLVARFDLGSSCWRQVPVTNAAWHGNAAGWVHNDELWVHGGHGDGPKQLVLPLRTGPRAIFRRTVQSITEPRQRPSDILYGLLRLDSIFYLLMD